MNAIAILLPTKSHDEAYRELFDRGETKVGYSLFAATKDFKVGDEVADQFGKKFTFTKEKEIELAHAVNDLPKELSDRTWHKILGELSPNATWGIKDGDEIDVAQEFIEEGISYYYENLDCKLHGIEKELAVLGPCGHYH